MESLRHLVQTNKSEILTVVCLESKRIITNEMISQINV